jgi:hypothetical protein
LFLVLAKPQTKWSYKMSNDPNLAAAGTGTEQRTMAVEPLPVLPTTPKIGNDKVNDYKVFKCSIDGASIHRPDGKRLAFVHGLHRTNIKQDIDFLEREIDGGNIYFERATSEDIARAEMFSDPLSLLRKQERIKIEAEVRAELETKIRAELMSAGAVVAARSAAENLGVTGSVAVAAAAKTSGK